MNIKVIGLLGLFFGIIGTTIGGFIGATLNIKNTKFLGFILEFAAGLMTAIICFDLIPEALQISNITFTIIGTLIGVLSMIFCDNLINKFYSHTHIYNNNLLKTGIIIAIGLSLHNFPEGLAIGAGFESSTNLGLKLAIAIAMHDIPEGISVALPLKRGGTTVKKSILITIFSGLTTGIGAFLGAIIGNISINLISISLTFAAGAMLYIVSCELIPESKKLYKGRFASLGNIIGLIIGLFSQSI